MGFLQNYLGQEPAYKDGHGLPLLGMMQSHCTDNGPALRGSGLGGKGKGMHFGLTGYQSTHNVGGTVVGSGLSTSVVKTYGPPRWRSARPGPHKNYGVRAHFFARFPGRRSTVRPSPPMSPQAVVRCSWPIRPDGISPASSW
jgi:hypothetical protein